MVNYDVLTKIADYCDDKTFCSIRTINKDMSVLLHTEMLNRKYTSTLDMFNSFQKDFYQNSKDFASSIGNQNKLKIFYKLLNMCFYKHKKICRSSRVGHMFFDTLEDKLDEFLEDGLSYKKYIKFKRLIAERRKM